jgi:hypothetical protein
MEVVVPAVLAEEYRSSSAEVLEKIDELRLFVAADSLQSVRQT